MLLLSSTKFQILCPRDLHSDEFPTFPHSVFFHRRVCTHNMKHCLQCEKEEGEGNNQIIKNKPCRYTILHVITFLLKQWQTRAGSGPIPQPSKSLQSAAQKQLLSTFAQFLAPVWLICIIDEWFNPRGDLNLRFALTFTRAKHTLLWFQKSGQISLVV